MLKIATLANVGLAQELCERLERHDIRAKVSHDAGIGTLIVGGTQVNVWILDDDNRLAAAAIAQAFLAEVAQRSGGSICMGCGYDLRAHHGDGHCPECGRAFRMPGEDVRCPSCDEEVPANFETCWNCGTEIESSHEGSPE